MSMPSTKSVKVWDPLVRVFHWSLVLSFAIAYLSSDDAGDIHAYAGYAVLGLVGFRLLWGIIGTRHARFNDFVYGPGKVIDYLRSLLTAHPRHYYGHNPAGGWMVLALLFMLLVSTVSGLEVYALEEGKGPLATVGSFAPISTAQASRDYDDDDDRRRDKDEDAADFWEDIHEASSEFALLLVVLHILGVVVSSLLHKENLVRAMITGRKPVPPADD